MATIKDVARHAWVFGGHGFPRDERLRSGQRVASEACARLHRSAGLSPQPRRAQSQDQQDEHAGNRDPRYHQSLFFRRWSGEREIAVITGSLNLKNARDRLMGCKAALREAGISIDPHLIREGDFRRETGFQICHELLSGGRHTPSALFVSNNMMTLGVLEALSGLGLRCPDDIAVASFDDFFSFSDVLRPALTAIAQPAYEIGARGAELLLNRVRGEMPGAEPVQIQLPTQLKVRESSLGPVARRAAS